MSEQDKQEAKERAEIAGTQAKHAAKNLGRAAKAGAKAGAEKVADEADDFYDAAKETTHNVADLGEHAARKAHDKARAHRLGTVALELAEGGLALTVSIWAGALALQKFRGAYEILRTSR